LAVLTQIRQGSGKGMGRAQSVGVVLAQCPAAAGEGVLAELASPLMLAQLSQGSGKAVVRAQGIGVILAQCPVPSGSG
jgi:hypothetical protein